MVDVTATGKGVRGRMEIAARIGDSSPRRSRSTRTSSTLAAVATNGVGRYNAGMATREPQQTATAANGRPGKVVNLQTIRDVAQQTTAAARY